MLFELFGSMSFFQIAALATVAFSVLVYYLARARSQRSDFSLLDGMIVAISVAILAIITIPFVEEHKRDAQVAAMMQNLHSLRSRIELYKTQHNGSSPIVYDGTLPQMMRKTNQFGEIGKDGRKYRLGPYLSSGVPLNPLTNSSMVNKVDSFPPNAAMSKAGWLYHEETGQIVPDIPEFLNK